MQILFIDESGTIPPKVKMNTANYFTLGGVIIPEDLWHIVDKNLSTLKKQFNIKGEIKWRYFASQNVASKHSLSHLNPKEKENLRFQLFNILAECPSINLICALVDVQAGYQLNNIHCENDLYWHAYKEMIDRFSNHLRSVSQIVGSKINGIIVCDHRQPKDDHQLRILHQNLFAVTEEALSSSQDLIEGVFIAPSHLSVGIQFADMIAGAAYRKFVRNDSRYWDLIEKSFIQDKQDKIEGYGLIKWPNQETPCRIISDPASIDAVTA